MEDNTTSDRVDSAGTNCASSTSSDLTPSATMARQTGKQGTWALTASSNQLVDAGTDSFFDTSGTESFTAGCWFTSTQGASAQTVLSHYDGSNDGWYIELRVSAARVAFHVDDGAAVSANGTWSTNTWTHVVSRFDHDAGSSEVTGFINGVSAATRNETTLGTDTAEQFTIGSESNGHGQKLSGGIDECFYVKWALTADAVCRICSCRIDGTACQCARTGDTYTSTGDNCGSCLDSASARCDAASPGTQ